VSSNFDFKQIIHSSSLTTTNEISVDLFLTKANEMFHFAFLTINS